MNDELKNKVQQLIEKKNTLEIESEVLKSLYYPLYDLLKEKTQEAITNNNIEIVKSALDNFVAQNHQEILESVKQLIDQQQQSIQSSVEKSREVDTIVVQAVENLNKEIQALAKVDSTPALQSAITESMQRVVNYIQSLNEQPDKIEYRRNKNGKISRVIESYDGYTITQVWRYDSDGYLASVTTTRSDEAA